MNSHQMRARQDPQVHCRTRTPNGRVERIHGNKGRKSSQSMTECKSSEEKKPSMGLTVFD
jgi:hypothetical protein